ncbi:LLM class flavin-dependent oxidoreductase [Allostreptomyces psammosilenae]|uniref:Alkanesulfonate monooxygenase SsuD/methylene tetrahydromethanopterin reductase-like flavin-dependent oxidoreductase (Luciferase family) n=1 Tax=Allostreptomyces psammosilenae TaxID=1892865 RepID=A0A852ZV80_9ACTN|nr:LLM class flavin-dependent oxidoreductase [Allostreptomyces psammosilenae]NYI06303.1 alkanesulfonate monooxygenase SsuD/methylene tetrahydromethanopterin reductase-like flavin-dependent oxidoreductase (luciferase family) [Allostreptomyces psammosilenae]
MRFGVSLPNAGRCQDLVAKAVLAEQHGWDGFFLWDHLNLDPATRPALYDPWVVLGAVAGATSRIRIGVLVTPLARRRPWKLAKEIVTLDHLSGGRVVAGVGLGSPEQEEFAAFGETLGARARADVLDEALPIVDALLRGQPVGHDGPRFRVDAHLAPAALQQPRPPLWVATTWPNRRPFRRALTWGDGVFALDARAEALPPEGVRELVAELAGTPAEERGFEVVVGRHFDHSAQEYERAGATWLIDQPAWIDTPPEEVDAFLAAGPPR